ncbi:hypothetical protein LINPERHAP1_LOCUS283 [Linum perenne]
MVTPNSSIYLKGVHTINMKAKIEGVPVMGKQISNGVAFSVSVGNGDFPLSSAKLINGIKRPAMAGFLPLIDGC